MYKQRSLSAWVRTVAVAEVPEGRLYVSYQDGTGKLVHNWLSANMSVFWNKHLFLPESLALNPLNYDV